MTETREKLSEAKYFFSLMLEIINHSHQYPHEYRYYFQYNLSAFLSAFRSVVYLLEKEYKNKRNRPIFVTWQKEKIYSDNKIQFLMGFRDITIHSLNLRPRGYFKQTMYSAAALSCFVKCTVLDKDGNEVPQPTPSPTPKAPTQASTESSSTSYENDAINRSWREDLWYFTKPDLKGRDMERLENIPESVFEEIIKIDVITLCQEGLAKLEAIVSECEQNFSVK